MGEVKKRIAISLGKQKALEIYLLLLELTINTLSMLPFPKSIFFQGNGEEFFRKHKGQFNLQRQEGVDLGQRMYNAINSSQEDGHRRNLLVGADIPDLSGDDIIQGLDKLENNDLVIGPAFDGGYYLIGTKNIKKQIFQDIPWGSPRVYSRTLERARELNLKVAVGAHRQDIDKLEDVLANPILRSMANP